MSTMWPFVLHRDALHSSTAIQITPTTAIAILVRCDDDDLPQHETTHTPAKPMVTRPEVYMYATGLAWLVGAATLWFRD